MTIATRLVPTAAEIGKSKIRVKKGTNTIPPPNPSIDPINPANMVAAISINISSFYFSSIDKNTTIVNQSLAILFYDLLI
jgi:hypothetical protein